MVVFKEKIKEPEKFEALKGFTSELYKQKVEQRKVAIKLAEREMVKIALIKQILSVIVFISAVTIGCMIGMILMRG